MSSNGIIRNLNVNKLNTQQIYLNTKNKITMGYSYNKKIDSNNNNIEIYPIVYPNTLDNMDDYILVLQQRTHTTFNPHKVQLLYTITNLKTEAILTFNNILDVDTCNGKILANSSNFYIISGTGLFENCKLVNIQYKGDKYNSRIIEIFI
tara:strand:+ start:101 stop:550 length:450 start_codon:yes stop_codon:yes gene_type:complete